MAIQEQTKYCVYCGATITPEERKVQGLPRCFTCSAKAEKERDEKALAAKKEGTLMEGVVTDEEVILFPVQ